MYCSSYNYSDKSKAKSSIAGSGGNLAVASVEYVQQTTWAEHKGVLVCNTQVKVPLALVTQWVAVLLLSRHFNTLCQQIR